jgi:transposase-like protein
MSEYKYVYGLGRSSLNIPESDIRYAMENTKSNAAAARFLKISFTSYKKYAKMYTDRDTGKTLYELHKNQFGVGIPKNIARASKGVYSIDKILSGEHPNYPSWKLRNRILALAILPEQCNSCGYEERRVTDDTVPLMLDHIDGDTTNHRIENIQMLCLNCYYQQTGNPFKQDKETYWNYNLLD